MVADELNIDQLNTALLLVQRRIQRLTQAMENFTKNLNNCKTLEEVTQLTLSISTTIKGEQ